MGTPYTSVFPASAPRRQPPDSTTCSARLWILELCGRLSWHAPHNTGIRGCRATGPPSCCTLPCEAPGKIAPSHRMPARSRMGRRHVDAPMRRRFRTARGVSPSSHGRAVGTCAQQTHSRCELVAVWRATLTNWIAVTKDYSCQTAWSMICVLAHHDASCGRRDRDRRVVGVQHERLWERCAQRPNRTGRHAASSPHRSPRIHLPSRAQVSCNSGRYRLSLPRCFGGGFVNMNRGLGGAEWFEGQVGCLRKSGPLGRVRIPEGHIGEHFSKCCYGKGNHLFFLYHDV